MMISVKQNDDITEGSDRKSRQKYRASKSSEQSKQCEKCEEMRVQIDKLRKVVERISMERDHYEGKLLIEIANNLQNQQELAQYRAQKQQGIGPSNEVQQQIKELKQSLDEQKMKIVKSKAETAQKEEQIILMNEQINKLNQEIDLLRGTIQTAKSQIKELKTTSELKLKNKQDNFKDQLRKAQVKIEVLEQQITDQKHIANQQQHKNTQKTKNLLDKMQELSQLMMQIQTEKLQLAEDNFRLRDLLKNHNITYDE